jgi:hypothetical protein
MAAAVVQTLATYENDASAGTIPLAPASLTVTAGNYIVAGFGYYGSALYVSGVTDNLGNTYTKVEGSFDVGQCAAELWAAPVTVGGTITAITATLSSNQTYRNGIAVEISGVASGPAVGGGVYSYTSTGTWMTSKTIPANGMAIGFVFEAQASALTAGAASGSPSTSITQQANTTGSMIAALSFALPGGSAVTGFTGTTNIATSRPAAGAGAIFSPHTGTSVAFVCGFECPTIGTDWEVHGTAALDTSIAGRNGAAAGRVDIEDSTATDYIINYYDEGTVGLVVVRFRLLISALPTNSTSIFKGNGQSYYDPRVLVNELGVLSCQMGGTYANGPTITPNTWHTVDLFWDGANKVAHWRVDGVAQTDPGAPANADTTNGIYFGKWTPAASGAFSLYVDDVVRSHTAGDYPIPDGTVVEVPPEVWISPPPVPGISEAMWGLV